MERCDFCSAMKIIREYISDERGLDQSEMLYRLFEGFFRSDDGEKLILDNGQVCRWLNGQAKLSPANHLLLSERCPSQGINRRY